MAELQKIQVVTRHQGLGRKILHHVVLWGFLVGAAGLSRAWFGGAWIIDLMILVVMVIVLYGLGRNLQGADVAMTRDEIAAWVRDGMPDNVNDWKKYRRDQAG